jgi:hypothetical protein
LADRGDATANFAERARLEIDLEVHKRSRGIYIFADALDWPYRLWRRHSAYEAFARYLNERSSAFEGSENYIKKS